MPSPINRYQGCTDMRNSLVPTLHRLRFGIKQHGEDCVSGSDVVRACLPSLRRHAEAMSGNQDSADAYMAAMMDILAIDRSPLPVASSPKVALFKLYTRLYAHLCNQRQPAQARMRQVLLLVLMEGFSNREAAEILDVSMVEVVTILRAAGCTKPESLWDNAGTRGKGRPVYRPIRMSSLGAAC
ncbi:hypothetical protein [Niveispirillum sp. KHB5.9]|uniref:hypothetical protein n=1 Tax=Niveispirillum sp. KHB5.9 TaxID=3400269 RepID=UPI003A8B2D9A